MTQNKLLATTVALALSMGGGVLQASEFELNPNCDIAGTSTDITCTDRDTGTISGLYVESPRVALEQFDPSVDATKVMPNSDLYFNVMYTFSEADPVQDLTTLTFTLTNATFEETPDARQIVGYENTDTGALAETAVPITAGDRTENSVAFDLNAYPFTAFDGTGVVVFRDFRVVADAASLASKSGRVTLRIEVESDVISDSKTISLVESTPYYSITLTPDSDTSTTYIDVAQGSAQFIRGTESRTYATLGVINVTAGSNDINQDDMLTPYSTVATAETLSGSLSIADGPFGQLTDTGADATQHLFIAQNGSGCDYETSTDAYDADSILADQAGWLVLSNISDGDQICIDVNADSVDELVETDIAPTGVLQIGYTGGNTISYSGTLEHLQRNGAVCTVFNVTDANRLDKSNIRITNFASREAIVLLTLEDMDGNTIIKDAELPSGAVGAKNTVYLNSEDLVALASSSESGVTEWGRGVLTIIADVHDDELDVALLLRSNAVQGNRTLMNMSVGASGSGCD